MKTIYSKTLAFKAALQICLCLFSFAVNAQRLTWDLKVPAAQTINKVSLEMQDWTGKSLYKDSIPLFGTMDNLPTESVKVGESRFNAGICGDMSNIRVNIHSNFSDNAIIDIYGIDGRLLSQHAYPLHQGENSILVNPKNLAKGVNLVRVRTAQGTESGKVIVGSDGNISGGKPENSLKSAAIDDWKTVYFIVSHRNLVTKKFPVIYSPSMVLNGNLDARAIITGHLYDVLKMYDAVSGWQMDKNGIYLPSVGVNDMKAFIKGDPSNFSMTKDGYFELKPDIAKGLVDTLYIAGGNSEDKRFYTVAKAVTIKDGEITDVNGRPNICTFPQMIFEGLDGAEQPLSEDLLDFLMHITGYSTGDRTYPARPAYNGSHITLDAARTRPLKAYLNRPIFGNAKADSIMAGYKLYEANPLVKIVEIDNQADADIVTLLSDNQSAHSDSKDKFITGYGWILEKHTVYLPSNGGSLWFYKWAAGHEQGHGFYDSGAHSMQLSDMWSLDRRAQDPLKLRPKEETSMKVFLFAPPNQKYNELKK